jgi:hypothetical protein
LAPQIHLGPPAPFGSFASAFCFQANVHAKRIRTNRSLLSGKRFDATEDRDCDRSAVAAQFVTEVVHPKSISRELAQENEDRPGIA